MTTNVGIVGYGRFGQAFARMCQAAGMQARCFDVHAAVPEALAASSLETLVKGAHFVVVAVPLASMPSVFNALAPLVTPSQIVLDVGSAKVEPALAMAQIFGARQPWVATHPLFGPASLARAEKPLNVVVCPNDEHAQAVDKTEAFFRSLGCEPMRLLPEAHDKDMAFTHALAFFVAKGMLDAGVPLNSPHAPPSFQGMARSIEAVRVDAGHLLTALHRFNPFAKGARADLMKALKRIDTALEEETDLGGAQTTAPALNIPDLGALSPELRETRELIDDVDAELLQLLARRAALSKRAGQVKTELKVRVRDPAREAQLLESRRQHAEQLGLNADAVEELFEGILRLSRNLQR